MNAFQTRPQSEEMATARRLLKRRASHGEELDLREGLKANAAFWTVEGLHPPYPPVGDVSDLPLPTLQETRAALIAAAEAASDVHEASLIGQAAAELNGDGLA